MNLLKIKLLVAASIVFAASSAFASISYDVTINTSSLASSAGSGYLYLDYQNDGGASSTATISNIVTDGVFGALDTVDIVNGTAVTGTLPNTVVFANTHTDNDYDQAFTFGNTISFLLTLSNPGPLGSLHPSGSSTFSFAVFADGAGNTPLLNVNGNGPAAPGTAFSVSLDNTGSAAAYILDSSVETLAPTPIPPSALLLAPGLLGLVGLRKKVKR